MLRQRKKLVLGACSLTIYRRLVTLVPSVMVLPGRSSVGVLKYTVTTPIHLQRTARTEGPRTTMMEH